MSMTASVRRSRKSMISPACSTTAIPAGDKAIVALAVDTVGGELRELTERYPDRKNTSVTGGEQERAWCARVLKEGRADPAANRHRCRRGAHCRRRYGLQELSQSDGCRRARDTGRRRPWSLFNPACMIAITARCARSCNRGACRSKRVAKASVFVAPGVAWSDARARIDCGEKFLIAQTHGKIRMLLPDEKHDRR